MGEAANHPGEVQMNSEEDNKPAVESLLDIVLVDWLILEVALQAAALRSLDFDRSYCST